MTTYHKDSTLPRNGEIFVFGSNFPRGLHGAGAAKAALQFGAKHGHGVGQVGNTYAIPTKDGNIQTLPLAVVQEHITAFIMYAKATPDTQYFLTAVGCGLAGFHHSQIAPLFTPTLANISYPDTWMKYLEK